MAKLYVYVCVHVCLPVIASPISNVKDAQT